MKKVLILSYYWPPGSGPGVQRWLKFCKFLPEFGWQPSVITVKNGSYPSVDESLEKDVPAELQVIKTKALEPFALYNMLRGKKGKSVEVGMGNVKGEQGAFSKLANYVRSNYFIPDARVGWNPYAIAAADQILQDASFDLIVTTGPPHSTHLAGKKIAEKHQIPWVADFRDPWTTVYYNEFLLRTKRSNERDYDLETSVLKNADSILVATPGLADELQDRARQIQVIPNGYDESDIPKSHQNVNERFTIAYVGNLKSNQNTEAVWESLSELNNEDRFREKFQLEVTGNVHPSIEKSWKEKGIDNLVNVRPFVPHKEAVQRMFDAHLLFLPIPNSPDNKRILTGKIFEYLAVKRPILGTGPTDGNAADIFNQCGHEAMVDYADKKGILSILRKYLDEFLKDQTPATVGNDAHTAYSRKGTCKSLADHFNDVTT